MRYALPTAEGKLCLHFGHCERFAIIDVEDGKASEPEFMAPPPHEPGVLPQWLSQQKVDVVIAGGMGIRALDLFGRYGIKVVIGAESGDPKQIVERHLAGALETGANICDH